MRRHASVTSHWNAADYAAHSGVQYNWARDLIARLRLRGDEAILDVGCGDGKVTAELADLVPRGTVLGVDSSPEMIAHAGQVHRTAHAGRLEFRGCDARRLGSLARSFDLIYSNAALHWVDDHRAFFQGAAKVLKPGGRLLVSCGGKGNAQDVFLALRPELRLVRWRQYFRKLSKPYFFHTPEDYHGWLPALGFVVQHIKLVPQEIVYPQPADLEAWIRTTWLPYVQRVPENERSEFIRGVVQRFCHKHPPAPDGGVSVKMVRLEIDALRIG